MFTTIKSILALLPVIIDTIKAIEAAVPGQGKGEQKLAAVREILQSIDSSVAELWPQISSVITAVVKLLNSTGGFNKA